MDTDTVEIPLEPFDIDWYDPGENCNPRVVATRYARSGTVSRLP
jgi:hypothetical protein